MRTLITLLMVSLAVSARAQSPAPSIGAPSLADVAKKAEASRKDGKAPGKVYSNGDLQPVVAPLTPAPDATAATAKPADTTAAAKDDKAAAAPAADATASKPGEAKDRAYWNKRMASAREQLERDRVLADALQSRINALTADFTSRDDPAQRSQVSAERQKALNELERLKTAIVADQKAIPAIEEEARRAGVPAGWLR